jgi:hypothetical protein
MILMLVIRLFLVGRFTALIVWTRKPAVDAVAGSVQHTDPASNIIPQIGCIANG